MLLFAVINQYPDDIDGGSQYRLRMRFYKGEYLMDIMTIVGEGMQHDLSRLAIISQNLANLTTAGYKKQIFIGQSFANQVNGHLVQNNLAGDAEVLQQGSLSIDASAGTLRHTANPQDVAIEGAGFFEMNTPAGPAYTRQGQLRADLNGRLVGIQDLALMGNTGEIMLTDAPFVVDKSGDVRQGERLAGHIKIIHFLNPGAMVPIGGGMYAQGAARFADVAGDSSVRFGFQENSNVNSAQEMVQLTETVRHFEALQKIMQGYDDSLDMAIRKLGDF